MAHMRLFNRMMTRESTGKLLFLYDIATIKLKWGKLPLVWAHFGWLAHAEAVTPQRLHQVMPFLLGCWELEVTWPLISRERTTYTCRLSDCGAVEDGLNVFMECPACTSIRAYYNDHVFTGRTIVTERFLWLWYQWL